MTVAAPPVAPGIAVWPILRDALLAGFVALVLAVPLVGFETVDVSGVGLGLNYRFGAVGVGVATVVIGRIALSLVALGHGMPILLASLAVTVFGFYRATEGDMAAGLVGTAAAVLAIRAAVSVWRRMPWPDDARFMAPGLVDGARRLAPTGFLALAVLFPFLPFVDQRVLDIAILVLTYVMLGWGLNIVVGLAGLLDLGYVAFYAVGAYTFGILGQTAGFSFWMALPLGGLLAALFGILLGFPVLRLRGDYLAIVTLGFGEIIRIVLLNWYEVTGGPNGIASIPRPSFFGMPFRAAPEDNETTFADFFGLEFSPVHRIIFLYFIILAMALAVNAFTRRIRRLPVGRAWEALREDEIACRSLGINPTNTKLSAFALGAMFAGFAGCFFAARQGFISPESFTFIESAVILAIVVLGGMGSQLGIVLAAIVLIGMPEFLRELNQFRMLAFGAGMVGIMVWRPGGLLSRRDPTIRLHPPRGPAAAGGRT
ncbi:branched-chain amino acid transport system permease protein [Stella humosa]|uniref:Branched-chain amino acid transport system permease protein n=1 Tax=Stella humosa TaxID=94 RepID=A0A3N1MDR6_9PROT|nr:high-affinity branched-chain amino acid ABC transporter permease LivM [Stella humosa]ROQ01429.1 branched-chain amino acid transport system permease protein [Stella humosa]BBK31805.1 branched-chain amino acid ABC transporter permease [Stella humosa]